jgi:excisionase family DNA binding protein
MELDSTRPLLTVTEAAAALGVSVYSCRQAIRTGLIPSVRFGRLIRVPVEGLRRTLTGGCDEAD